ncbi:hypothetical protein OAS39_07005, partial [Pirellulales bacterium]|nr:hypothetical protein [Pirellulales bacterium]
MNSQPAISEGLSVEDEIRRQIPQEESDIYRNVEVLLREDAPHLPFEKRDAWEELLDAAPWVLRKFGLRLFRYCVTRHYELSGDTHPAYLKAAHAFLGRCLDACPWTSD